MKRVGAPAPEPGRGRSATEIVDAAFELLRKDYLSLITVTAAIQLPLIVLQMAIGIDMTNPTRVAQHLWSFIGLALVGALAMFLADSAIIVMVSDMYMGKRANVGRALGRMLQRSVHLLVAGFLRMVFSYVSLLAFIIPGIYVFTRFTTLPAVVVLEERDIFDSIGRSWDLGKDRVGDTFVTMFLGGLIYGILSWIFTFGLQWLGTLVPALAQPSIVMTVQRLPVVFFYPLVSVITTLIYYDIRVRKEAFDLEMMANELGPPKA